MFFGVLSCVIGELGVFFWGFLGILGVYASLGGFGGLVCCFRFCQGLGFRGFVLGFRFCFLGVVVGFMLRYFGKRVWFLGRFWQIVLVLAGFSCACLLVYMVMVILLTLCFYLDYYFGFNTSLWVDCLLRLLDCGSVVYAVCWFVWDVCLFPLNAYGF